MNIFDSESKLFIVFTAKIFKLAVTTTEKWTQKQLKTVTMSNPIHSIFKKKLIKSIYPMINNPGYLLVVS
jgi:hypothetical protein